MFVAMPIMCPVISQYMTSIFPDVDQTSSCVDTRSDCVETLTKHPDMCTDTTQAGSYAWHNCRHTCGIGGILST